MKTILITLMALSTLAFGEPAAKPTEGRVEGWTGPFKDLKGATGTNDASQLPQMPDIPDPLIQRVEHPADWNGRLPFDALMITLKQGSATTWHLVTHTWAGWFVSPPLGVDDNHGHCSFDSTNPYGNRLAIAYACTVGGTSQAYKLFSMFCGVDAAGRPGCGRVVISARNNVHVGSPEGGTDTTHDTVSCKPSFADDTISLEASDPDDDGGATYSHELAACTSTHYPLDAHAYKVASAGSWRFDSAGRWR